MTTFFAPLTTKSSASTAPAGAPTWPWVTPLPGACGDPPRGGRWPTFSVVTPNYNYADLIETTLRSVLMQDYPALEYIVLDDGSTDRSIDIIRNYDTQLAHWSSHANMGQYATINKGFAKATGEIHGWINSDDIHLPWTLRTVADIFAAHPEVQWIVGHPVRMQNGVIHACNKLVPYPRELIRAGFFHGEADGLGWIQQESCFWRRGLWEKAGGLKPEHRYAADYELWTRFAEHADLYAVSTVLGGFTVRGEQNRSIANRNRYMDEVRSIQKRIAASAAPSLARVIAKMDRFEKIKRRRGVRAVAKRLLGLKRFKGPVLRWDFNQARHVVEWTPYFT